MVFNCESINSNSYNSSYHSDEEGFEYTWIISISIKILFKAYSCPVVTFSVATVNPISVIYCVI